ncbi:hypothetical protein ACO1GU_03890 [Fusobacterium watanabei]|uniref:hypothetical protein n=1 Tax=Fusobacterium watanabei TaxID=2686067 RepID=UPI003B5878C6
MISIEELNNKIKIEAEELIEKKIVYKVNFLSEEEKELFKKKVLELVSSGNIVELQNIIKEDFRDTSRILQNNKWSVLEKLTNDKYIEAIINIYLINNISNIEERYNILDTIPVITGKGIEELKRLKKIYGE